MLSPSTPFTCLVFTIFFALCADLVKFLLDTDRFAVVQDMIGIAGDLPKISAVVESKSEILPVVGTQLITC